MNLTPDLDKLGLATADSLTGSIPTALYPGTGDDGLLYPGTLGWIAGPSGTSKSLASHNIMAWWTHNRGYVVDMDGEDGGSTGGMARKRAEAAGADLSKFLFGDFTIPRDCERVAAAIEQLGDNVLFVWDTADTWIDAPLQRWGKALQPLADVLAGTDSIGILIHHTLKHVRKGSDWRVAVGGGTSGIIGKSRFGLLYGIRPDDSSQRVMVKVKDSYGDPKESGAYDKSVAFEIDTEDLDDGNGNLRPVALAKITDKRVAIADPTGMVYLGGDGGGARGPAPEKLAEAADWLVKQLGDGAMPTSDAAVCMTKPDGDTNGGCGWMDASKCAGGCPYCGGPVKLVQGLKETAEQDSISWGGAVKKALTALACESSRKGSAKAPGGLVFYWRFPDGHPGIKNATAYRKDLP